MKTIWIALNGSPLKYAINHRCEFSCILNTYSSNAPSGLISLVTVDVQTVQTTSDGTVQIATNHDGLRVQVYGREITEGRQLLKGVIAQVQLDRAQGSFMPSFLGTVVDTGVLVTETGPRPDGRTYTLVKSAEDILPDMEAYGDCVRVAIG